MKHHRKSNRYTDVVQVDDVLGSMAESLMERQPKSFKPKLVFQDKKVAFKIGGKPPREIFYRKTSTFLTKLPPPVPSKLCSCAFLCSGSPATIKCHSCSIYDPSGCAFFCDLCFRARHPWHRIPHVYTAIQADESIEHTLKISHRIAEAKRYEQEGSDILRTLLEEKAKLAIVGDDEKLDNQMWDYGRRMVALEQYVMNLRKKIHEDTYQHSLRKSLVVDSSEMKQLEQFRQSQMLKDLLENFNASLQLAAEKEKEKERERESTLVVYRPEIGEVEIAEGEVEGSESVAEGERREVGPSSEVIEDVIPEVIVVSEVTAAEPETVEMGVVPGSAEEVPEETAQSSADPDPVNDPGPGPDPGPNPVDKLATGPVVPAPAYVPAFDPIPAPVDPEVTHAATCVQKVFKAFVARRIVSSVLATRVVRVWSPQYARDYFYDRVSGVSSWTPSKVTSLCIRCLPDGLLYCLCGAAAAAQGTLGGLDLHHRIQWQREVVLQDKVSPIHAVFGMQ